MSATAGAGGEVASEGPIDHKADAIMAIIDQEFDKGSEEGGAGSPAGAAGVCTSGDGAGKLGGGMASGGTGGMVDGARDVKQKEIQAGGGDGRCTTSSRAGRGGQHGRHCGCWGLHLCRWSSRGG